MLTVSSCISFHGNCREAVEFYRDKLEAEVLFIQTVGESPISDMGPPDQIMHCTIKIGDSTIMMGDDPHSQIATGSGNISLAISLSEPARAKEIFSSLAEDGAVVMPLQETYWAHAFGILIDKFGVRWMINCDTPTA